MSAEYTFKWDKSLPVLKQDKGFTRNLNLFIANNAHRRMSKYTPMDTGMLDQNVQISANEIDGEIIYLSPYAEVNYYGVDRNFSKEKHPLATSFWDKPVAINESEAIAREVDKYRKKHSV